MKNIISNSQYAYEPANRLTAPGKIPSLSQQNFIPQPLKWLKLLVFLGAEMKY